jgi:hypothetical protein
MEHIYSNLLKSGGALISLSYYSSLSIDSWLGLLTEVSYKERDLQGCGDRHTSEYHKSNVLHVEWGRISIDDDIL